MRRAVVGRVLRVSTVALVASWPAQAFAQASEARKAYGAGRYDDAIDRFEALVERGEAYPEADRGLVRALAEVGRYAEAESAAMASVDRHPESPELQLSLGRVLRRTGDLSGAERALRAAVDGGASDALAAELELGRLAWDRGEREVAEEIFDGILDVYRRTGQLSAEALTAIGSAARYLGMRDNTLLRDALSLYDEAIAADPSAADPHLRVGELFLDKYNSQDAGASFGAVLSRNPTHPDALLGMGRRAQFDGSTEALEHTLASLEVNPNHVQARAFLARLYVGIEDYGRAEEEALQALEVNASSLDALAVLGAARYLGGNEAGFRAARDRALALNPGYADFYNTVGETAARTHFYADAVRFGRLAVKLDPYSWRGQSLLGLNLLRTGDMEEGRQVLETAFAGDPFNVWVKNTLDMLDNVDTYVELDRRPFRFVMDPAEADVLGVYMEPLAHEAFSSLARRYGYEPPTPIRLEVFSRHADFSVRTVGTAGFGALGVSFGSILVMDSPSARQRGTFNWGSTLWHEMSHAFTLGMTAHRVPRWFSEGLAVHDERAARPGWGSDVRADWLLAFKEERLRHVSELNYGFVRPAYPQQIVHSYFQASLLCAMIEEMHGFDALLAMLDGYRRGLDTDAVFGEVLGTDARTLDSQLRAWVERRYATPLASLDERRRALDPAKEPDAGDFAGQLARGWLLVQAGAPGDAIPYFSRARDLFPEYASVDSPYRGLAAAYDATGDPSAAAEALARQTAIDENDYDSNVKLAELHETAGELPAAAAALERAVFVDPFPAEIHERLAELGAELGNHETEVRERRVLLASGPVDRAAAHYRLARAYDDAGQAADARRQVLLALEIAPNYVEAQDLLLELREERRDP